MQLSCSLITHFCDHKGVSSPRGGLMGLIFHPRVPAVLPRTWQVLSDVPRTKLNLWQLKDVGWGKLGS